MLSFSREIKPNNHSDRVLHEENLSIYQLFDNQNKISDIEINNKFSLINYNDKKFHIDVNQKIYETSTSNLIGYFKKSNWSIWQSFDNKFILDGKEYEFIRLQHDIKYSIFKKSTWGCFKFELSNNDDFIIYDFVFESLPIFNLGNIYMEKSFKGIIETHNLDPFIITCGFQFIENRLKNELYGNT